MKGVQMAQSREMTNSRGLALFNTDNFLGKSTKTSDTYIVGACCLLWRYRIQGTILYVLGWRRECSGGSGVRSILCDFSKLFSKGLFSVCCVHLLLALLTKWPQFLALYSALNQPWVPALHVIPGCLLRPHWSPRNSASNQGGGPVAGVDTQASEARDLCPNENIKQLLRNTCGMPKSKTTEESLTICVRWSYAGCLQQWHFM